MTTTLQPAPGASTLLASLPDRQGFGDASLVRHRPGSIDLGGGNPDTGVLPTGLYRDAVRDLTDDPGFASTLRYAPAAGLESLRSVVAAREGVDASRVIVTSGGIHGLALAVLGTLDPGDTVVVDDPVFPLFLRVLDLVGGLDVVPVRVDAQGLDVELLEEGLRDGLRPRALFTVPTFHNPTGATLTAGRAQRLVELAETYGFTVFLDDPYRDIAFAPDAVPERPGAQESDRVISVHTFSKTLGPGLRLGWNVVPEGLAPAHVKLRNRLDGQASGFLQEVVRRVLDRPEHDEQLLVAAAHYRDKAEALVAALGDTLGEQLQVTAPAGGFFVWARPVDLSVDPGRLFDLAQDEGVFVQRGEWFAVDDDTAVRGHLRLSFSEKSVPELQEGVARLGRAWVRARG
ncbi:PLP-dependent aminotransferase family protein [Aquipuribacter hungaricus]|uniref:PLP-dependent aminotransferase family protein n=1 Tax=Aquipuribacter hungaricus TaxID=545624 RepID=A0ABV7WHH0_9MICO